MNSVPAEYSNPVLRQFAAQLVRGYPGRVPQIAIGPVVWEAHAGAKCWYFTVASQDAEGFAIHRLVADGSKEAADRDRSALTLALLQHRPAITHDFDDELEMGRWCAVLWPCTETATLLAGIELERRPAAGQA
jgi:hypothetical protein